MSFYHFRQNNSGGSFIGPAISVLVEADSADEANAIAEANGIYFDFEYEIDCDCCGMRWWPVTEGYDAHETVDEFLREYGISDFTKAFAKSDRVPAYALISRPAAIES